MAIDPIQSSSIPDAFKNTATQKSKSERDMFMTLLVAQLKNQDPLQPQDGTEFVAQLAQFNSLDQLIGIRNSIETLSRQIEQERTPTNSSQTN